MAEAGIRLDIKKADGSTYWQPVYFNSQAEGDTWLAAEKLKPYWGKGFTTTFTDMNPPPTADQIAAKAAVDAAAKTQLSELAVIRAVPSSLWTADQQQKILMDYLKMRVGN